MQSPPHLITGVLAGIVAYFAVQNHFGFVVGLLLPILLIYFVVGFIRLFLRKEGRRPRATRMAIWLTVLVAGVAMQGHWAKAAREECDAAARAVRAFKAQTGNYPQALTDVHIDADKLSQRWMLSYRLIDGKPLLAYTSTWMPMDAYAFDFDDGSWKLNSY